MKIYLGCEIVDIKDTPYKDYKSKDWALYFIQMYGCIDGAHHKDWVLDQVSRCLNDTPIKIELAKWDDGQSEYRISTGEPSQIYKDWVLEMLGDYDDENEEYEYSYEEGCPP